MRIVYSTLLVSFLWLSGCAFSDWATHPQGPEGKVPAVEAAKDIGTAGLNGLEQGGVVAGVIALVLTAGKSAARLYSDYQASKPQKAKPVMP